MTPQEPVTPFATVAILTKNPGKLFQDVLLAVLAQETNWPYEILVIDSGSTDGTLDFIGQFPDVRLTRIPPEEFGHGKTRNLAMSTARGKYVAMLTHDAKPLDTHWLSRLVAPLELDHQVAGVFGRHVAYPEATPCIKRDINLHFDHFQQWPLIVEIDDHQRYANDQGYRQVLHFFSDNNACLRKSIWESIPYPEVDFAEDQLWAKMVIESGFKKAYANEATVYHSHEYSILNTLRRSFDESRALNKLFGYDLCPGLLHAARQIFYCSARDLLFLMRNERFLSHCVISAKTPLLHTARQTGFYLGRYRGPLEKFLFRVISLDNSIKRR